MAFDYPVTQTRLDIPRPLITQSHRHGWAYQGLYLPSHTDTAHTDTAGHTKAFIYRVTQTRLGIPRPLFTESHRHGWAYQGLYLPSHTDTAGHTKAFDYPVTQTRLDIPRPLITQSHRHGWAYQGLYLPSHGPGGGVSQSAPAQGRFKPLHSEHANHQTTMTAPRLRINYSGSSAGGSSPCWGIVCENSPAATCRPSPGGP